MSHNITYVCSTYTHAYIHTYIHTYWQTYIYVHTAGETIWVNSVLHIVFESITKYSQIVRGNWILVKTFHMGIMLFSSKEKNKYPV